MFSHWGGRRSGLVTFGESALCADRTQARTSAGPYRLAAARYRRFLLRVLDVDQTLRIKGYDNQTLDKADRSRRP